MSVYSAKYRLTSCKVNLQLLAEIEDMILTEAGKYFTGGDNPKSNEEFESLKKERYHVFIEEKGESLKLLSIREYKDKHLPDGTRTIHLDFSSMVDKFFHIKVQFHSSISEQPLLEISMSDVKAKELCGVIAEGIIKTVKKHKNFNHIFHNRVLQMGLLFLFAFYNIGNYILLFYSKLYSPYALVYNIVTTFAFTLVVFWLIISIFVCRYTTFDSDRQKNINIGYYLFTIVWFLFIVFIIYNRLSKIY